MSAFGLRTGKIVVLGLALAATAVAVRAILTWRAVATLRTQREEREARLTQAEPAPVGRDTTPATAAQGETPPAETSLAERALRLREKPARTAEKKRPEAPKDLLAQVAALSTPPGRGTPLAALQTLAWAVERGQWSAFDEALAFEGPGQRLLREWVETLPVAARGEFTTPERVIGLITAEAWSEDAFFPGEVRFTEARGPDRPRSAQLAIDRVDAEGTVHRHSLYAVETEQGWKWVVPEATVRRTLQRLSAKPQTSASGGGESLPVR